MSILESADKLYKRLYLYLNAFIDMIKLFQQIFKTVKTVDFNLIFLVHGLNRGLK